MMGSSYLHTYCFVLTFLLPEIILLLLLVFSTVLVSLHSWQCTCFKHLAHQMHPWSWPNRPSLAHHLPVLLFPIAVALQKLTGKTGKKVQSQLSISLKNVAKKSIGILQKTVYSVSSLSKAQTLGLIDNLQLSWAASWCWVPVVATGKVTISPRGQQQDSSSYCLSSSA